MRLKCPSVADTPDYENIPLFETTHSVSYIGRHFVHVTFHRKPVSTWWNLRIIWARINSTKRNSAKMRNRLENCIVFKMVAGAVNTIHYQAAQCFRCHVTLHTTHRHSWHRHLQKLTEHGKWLELLTALLETAESHYNDAFRSLFRLFGTHMWLHPVRQSSWHSKMIFFKINCIFRVSISTCAQAYRIGCETIHYTKRSTIIYSYQCFPFAIMNRITILIQCRCKCDAHGMRQFHSDFLYGRLCDKYNFRMGWKMLWHERCTANEY